MNEFDSDYCQPLGKGSVLESGHMFWGQHGELPIETWERMTERDRSSFNESIKRHPPSWKAIPPDFIGMKSDETMAQWSCFGFMKTLLLTSKMKK